MVPKLKQNLFHVERGRKSLDKHRRANSVVRHPNVGLREDKDVIPEPRLHIVFHFWKVVIRPITSLDKLIRVVEEVERKVEQRARHGLIVYGDSKFIEMPPSGPGICFA